MFSIETLRQPLVIALAELAGAGVEVTTAITIRKVACVLLVAFIGFTTSVRAAEPIDAAMVLLCSLTMPPIVVIEKTPNYVAASAEGFVVKGRAIIYIPKDTPLWRLALAGDKEGLIRLAAVIAHEHFHIQHGLAEGPAGVEELRVLRLLGASQTLMNAKQRAHMRVQ